MKLTQLEKAIQSIDADIAVLEAARKRLVDQQLAADGRKAKQRKPRAVVREEPKTA